MLPHSTRVQFTARTSAHVELQIVLLVSTCVSCTQWIDDSKLPLGVKECVAPSEGRAPIQGVFPSYIQGSRGWLWVNHNPDQIALHAEGELIKTLLELKNKPKKGVDLDN